MQPPTPPLALPPPPPPPLSSSASTVTTIATTTVDSSQFFRTHWRLWRLLGCVRDPLRYPLAYRLYSTCINGFIMFFYPAIVFVALFNSSNLNYFLQTLPICAAALACSVKYINYYRRLDLVWQVEEIFNALDEHVQLAEDRNFHAGIHRRTNLIMNMLRVVCSFFFLITVMSFVSSIEERSLAFNMELPFDWRASTKAYLCAVLLELLLLACDLLQSLVNDSFPPIALCVLSYHTRLLGERLARIGYGGSKDVHGNIAELQRCIVDHQHLYRLHAIIQEIISAPVFVQYAVTAFQDCFTVLTFIFYTDTASGKILYFTYLLALQMQIFPICYYGSDCAQSSADLLQRAYASNWLDQSCVYHRLMRVFSQRSLKNTTAYAMGLIPINLGAFVKTLQGAYSFYTFVNGLRKL